MADEEKKVTTQDEETSNFRNSTLKALERLRLQNEALTTQANLNKQKTLAYEREQKKKKKREELSAKITNVTGLAKLAGLQGLTGTQKKKEQNA